MWIKFATSREFDQSEGIADDGGVAKWQGKGLQNPYTWVRIPPPPYLIAGVVEQADTPDLKSCATSVACGFDSRPRHF